MASKKFAKAQEEAKKYVDQHNLERFVTQMMNGMIQAKPADPKIYMIRFIAERCSVEKMAANGITVEGLPPPSPTKSPGKAKPVEPADQAPKEEEPSGQELGSDAPKPETLPPRPVGSADAEIERWAQVEGWEQLAQMLEDGAQLPPPGATATVGGPKWLASKLGAANEEQTVARLQWLSQRDGSYLFQVDSDGTNLAMALSGKGGEGKWNDWLFDRGICVKDAKDDAGNTVQDHAKRASAVVQSQVMQAVLGGSSGGSSPLPPGIATRLSTWELLVADIKEGGEIIAGTSSMRSASRAPAPGSYGTPSWLAPLIASGGPGAVIERLQYLSNEAGGALYQVDAEDTNIAMALAKVLGKGPWLEWLFDRGICMTAATDKNGKTAMDYCA